MKFNTKQLSQLDVLQPFIDEQETESRKGQSQFFPMFRILGGETFYCQETGESVPICNELVGTWINMKVSGDQYLKWKDVRLEEWHRAVQKEFTEVRWVKE